jgi:hypothetical protein
MTENRDFSDDDLRARFARLRREEEALAPQFVVSSRAASGLSPWWSAGKLIAVAVCLVTMVAAVVLLRLVPQGRERKVGQPVASLTEWRAPTDFLLETPGRELLRTVPAIGVCCDDGRASGPGQKSAVVRTRKRKQALP